MKEGLTFRVAGSEAGCRLDRFLKDRLPGFPPRSIEIAIGAGHVFVGGRRGTKGRRLSCGEEVVLRKIAEAADWLPIPGDLPGASILYADGAVAVLDKPPGCHTEPQRPFEAGTLAGYLRWRFPCVETVPDGPGLTLLSRLDRGTSGAVLAALSAGAFAFLREQREKGALRKSYLCVVAGILDERLTLSFRLDAKGGEGVRPRRDIEEPDPRYWTVVEPLRALGAFTLVRAAISKGKRHQVRAHLAGAGFPIAGDRLYGRNAPVFAAGDRMWLHAASVEFPHPATMEATTVESPVPAGFGLT